jgi:hypothetical protein
MKHKKVKLSMFLLGLGLTTQAQQATTATGGNALGSGGSASYSLGQAAYTSSAGATGSVSQGVQQAYEIVTLGTNEIAMTISPSVFPNPTTDNLTLQVKDFSTDKLNYELYNMQGMLLETKQINANQTQINMSRLPIATYFIKVISDNKQVQSFKIIKK